MRHELVPGSLEVYPIEGIGALEIGVHVLHHPGREEIELGRLATWRSV